MSKRLRLPVIGAVVAGIVVSAGVATVARASTDSLVISLEVTPEERVPTRLCVLTRLQCRKRDQNHKLTEEPCDNTARLNSVEDFFKDRGDDAPAGFRTLRSSKPPGIPPAIDTALRALAAAPVETRLCSGGGYGACAPEIDLREFRQQSGSGPAGWRALSGQIVCGSQHHAQDTAHPDRDDAGEHDLRDEQLGLQRVALLSLDFHEDVVDSIDEVKLGGTVARVHLKHPTSAAVTIRVIGGHYAIAEASSSFTVGQPMSIALRSRCERFFAEVPAHKAPIKAVDLQLGVAHHGCAPNDRASSIVPIELPYTPAGEGKSLTVTYEGGATSEVRWFASEPPSPLRLGARSIRFSWRRPVGCLAERWREQTPSRVPVAWNQTCPRARLSNAAPCKIVESNAAEVCQYHCEIPKEQPAVRLPVPVVFERVRSHVDEPGQGPQEHAEPEILYSWRDQIDDADQELASVVPPADRRVMLEFPDPDQWTDRLGDEIDEIRVFSAQSAHRLDLLDLNHNKTPPHWVSLPSAGRTCGDRVRVAIVGTWRYEERTFDGQDGRIELTHPEQYRKRTLFYGLAGAGDLFRHLGNNARSAMSLDLGFGLQLDPARWSPSLRSLTLDVEGTGQITHTFYEGIELAKPQPQADFTSVPYLRFDLRVAVEWWWRRRVGLAGVGGVGLGTPLYASDASKVGALQRSELLELHPMIFALLPTRLWFLIGAGLRAGEQHRDYRTGFLGTPTPDPERDRQWYLFLRFRTALE